MKSHGHSPIAGMDIRMVDSRVKTEHWSHSRKTGKKGTTSTFVPTLLCVGSMQEHK